MKCPKCKHDVNEHDQEGCAHLDGTVRCACSIDSAQIKSAANLRIFLLALAGIAVGVPAVSGLIIFIAYRIFGGG